MSESVTFTRISKSFTGATATRAPISPDDLAPDGANLVLTKIDLQVRAGEFVAIVGPSGWGRPGGIEGLIGLRRPPGPETIPGRPARPPTPPADKHHRRLHGTVQALSTSMPRHAGTGVETAAGGRGAGPGCSATGQFG